jgi:hypothetical protein
MIQTYIDQIKKMSSGPGTKPPGPAPSKGTTPAKTGSSKPVAQKPKKTTTKAIVKK